MFAAVRAGDGADGLVYAVAARVAGMHNRHDERRRGVDHVLEYAADDASFGVLSQRLDALEDRRARPLPLNALSRRPIRCATWAVGCGRPDDRLTITARDQEQALARCRRTVV